MQGKARFIFPILVTGQIVFLVTCLATLLNVGAGPTFFADWMRSFVVAWPAAATIAFVAIPVARRATDFIVGVIDGRA